MATDGDNIEFAIHKYGDITFDSNTDCTEIGPVFNPLQDPHVTTPETRGSIDTVVVDTSVQTQDADSNAVRDFT